MKAAADMFRTYFKKADGDFVSIVCKSKEKTSPAGKKKTKELHIYKYTYIYKNLAGPLTFLKAVEGPT